MQGDLLDLDALRAAFRGVDAFFLLNAVTGDEFSQAIITLNVAREAGVERVVYLSVIHADRFVNVPHFAVKYGAERMLQEMGFSATVLRPTYFIDNDHTIKDVVLQHGVYPMPIGGKGLAMWGVDAYQFTAMPPEERVRKAVDYGSRIHPQYRDEFEHGVAVGWHRSPFTLGCFGVWSDAARERHYDNLCQVDGRIVLAGEHAGAEHGDEQAEHHVAGVDL